MVMEIQSPLASQRREEPDVMNLREWGVKARMISCDNSLSRRFSSSYITSFREDGCKSFRSNFTISSTASSPGYSLKEEIDPSTYSFTNALKALQLRSIYTWEYLSPDQGFALNSKWNEAEKYICNPLSGEVPMECLSSKTLMNGRSFRNITNRMTMSAPLIHHSSRLFHGAPHQHQHKFANVHPLQDDIEVKENKTEAKTTMIMKRDVGIQSTPTDTSPSPSAASTPPIHERSKKDNLASQAMDSPNSSSKSKSKCQAEVKEEKEEKTNTDDEDDETQKLSQSQRKNSKKYYTSICLCRQGESRGCLSIRNLWSRKTQKQRNITLSINSNSN